MSPYANPSLKSYLYFRASNADFVRPKGPWNGYCSNNVRDFHQRNESDIKKENQYDLWRQQKKMGKVKTDEKSQPWGLESDCPHCSDIKRIKNWKKLRAENKLGEPCTTLSLAMIAWSCGTEGTLHPTRYKRIWTF